MGPSAPERTYISTAIPCVNARLDIGAGEWPPPKLLSGVSVFDFQSIPA